MSETNDGPFPGLQHGYWRQLGIREGDSIETITSDDGRTTRRITGVLRRVEAGYGPRAVLDLPDGTVHEIGNWRGKRWARLVAPESHPVERQAAAKDAAFYVRKGQRSAESRRATVIEAVLNAPFEVAEVDTLVELVVAEPQPWPDPEDEPGTYDKVQVMAVRYVGDGREPILTAKGYYQPAEGAAYWRHLPPEVAHAWIGRALL